MATGLELLTLSVAGLASLFMAWTIGAGSSGSTPFSPAVGAGAISILRAAFVVGLLGFLGAILQGANVSETMGRGLIEGVTLTAGAVAVTLVIAAGLVSLGVFRGYPIATAFTVTGAVVGAGLAMGGDPAWSTYARIGGLWVAIPFIAGGVAYATAKLLRHPWVPEEGVVPVLAGLVGLVLANVRFVGLGSDPGGASLAQALGPSIPGGAVLGHAVVSLALATVLALVTAQQMAQDPRRGQRRFLLALGGLVAFSAGGSQVGLAVGPILPQTDPYGLPLLVVLGAGGLGLLLGSWTGAPRMIKALARDYSSLGPRRSIAALIPGFLLAQTAVLLGVPVSFNEIIVSSIIGSGYAAGGAAVSWPKMAKTVAAWIGSLVLALGLGFGGVWVLGVVV